MWSEPARRDARLEVARHRRSPAWPARRVSGPGGTRSRLARPSRARTKVTSGRASAARRTVSPTCALSVAVDLRNLRRAGTLKKRSRTSSTRSPGQALPQGRATTVAAPFHDELHPFRERAKARAQREARDGADARERLAAEPERRDREEILDPRDLARRMALERQARILLVHPLAVIDDPDARRPPLLDLDPHARGGRVERVLDQLLHDARRAHDHLTRRDLVGQVAREPPHLPHRAPFYPWPSGPGPAAGSWKNARARGRVSATTINAENASFTNKTSKGTTSSRLRVTAGSLRTW